MMLNTKLKDLSPLELKAHFDAEGVQLPHCIAAFGVEPENCYVQAARQRYESDDVEIDEITVLSESDEGAWVLSWLYVSNDLAGVDEDPSHSEVLESLIEVLKPRIAMLSSSLQAKIGWLEETLGNFSEEIDDIASETLHADATATLVHWALEGAGTETFLPSAALLELIASARVFGLDSERAAEAEWVAKEFGDKLDCALTSAVLAADVTT